MSGRIRSAFAARDFGPATIILLAVALAVQWALMKPTGESGAGYFGQWVGAEAILLFSVGLIMISTLPWVEAWFDGIDRAAIWHRRVMITGLFLMIPHIALASGDSGSSLGGPLGLIGLLGMLSLAVWAILPRWRSVLPTPVRKTVLSLRDVAPARGLRKLLGGYDRWRSWHRTAGLFVAAGFAHGLMDGSPWAGAPALRWTYVAIGGIGLAFYFYRELLARFFQSLHDYKVHDVRVLDESLVEISLDPIGRPVEFVPGQFAMLYLEVKDGWHRHPFTIASAPHEKQVRVTVKSLGDYTSKLREMVQPGMPAVIGGPHGRFDHHKGTKQQAWIAAGVGVAPFLSWLRALDENPHERIDFFYTVDGEAPFIDEITDIAGRHPSLHAHLIDTSVTGRLTPDQVLSTVDSAPLDLSVFMCGPAPMLRSFQSGLRRGGVPPKRIHREYFDWR